MAPPPPPQTTPAAYTLPKRDFIGKPAPPGYVAGIGRGATGFTTRSDIGPAREFVKPETSEDSAGPSTRRAPVEDEDAYLNESNYDEFAGYAGSLFKSGDPYEDDDKEADKIYEQIDRHMDERGKAIREARARQELELYRQKRPKIQQQFMDLKGELKNVTEDEWAAIPEVGDARNRKQRVARQDKFTPVPDSLLAHQAKLSAGGEKLVYLDPKSINNDDESDDDIVGATNKDKAMRDSSVDKKNPILPLEEGQGLEAGELSDFRSSVLSMKLSLIEENKTAGDDSQQTSSVNAHDYLTNLQSTIQNQITDTAMVNEYRKQFAALRHSNPKFQNAWIASVRLEEAAGKLKAARELIMEACHCCPKSADLWLEAARLHPEEAAAKRLLVEAIKACPRSEKLWLKAAELEAHEETRRRVFEKARKMLPKSVALWRKSIELEPASQAKVMLRDAVGCCPQAVEFWLALARLSPYEEANQVLKEANERNPKDRTVWLTAARLQEQVGKADLVEKIIQLSVTDLASKGVPIERSEWLHEAALAEEAGFKVTCREIISRIIGWGIEEGERLKTWLADARAYMELGRRECARAAFNSIIGEKMLARMESVWLELAKFERSWGDRDSLIRTLEQAVEAENCKKSEALWLELAEQRRSELEACRRTLSEALAANPDSERIVLAAVELELEHENVEVARRILAEACASAKTAELVLRSAELERSLANFEGAERLLSEGAREYKNRPEFYLRLGQLAEQQNEEAKAKSWYSDGLKYNPTSIELWISMARLEERSGSIPRARSKLEAARLRNPKCVRLWLEAAQLEWRQFLARQASGKAPPRARPDLVTTTLAKGIKECRECADVSSLLEMQADIGKRKFG